VEFVRPGGAVVGIELDPGLVHAARARGRGLRPLLRIECGDILNPDLRWGPADAGVCQAVLCHEQDHLRWLRAMGRVLAPGAPLASLEPAGTLSDADALASGLQLLERVAHPEGVDQELVLLAVPSTARSTIIRGPKGASHR
jgi:SAM-dependent methyltransferase